MPSFPRESALESNATWDCPLERFLGSLRFRIPRETQKINRDALGVGDRREGAFQCIHSRSTWTSKQLLLPTFERLESTKQHHYCSATPTFSTCSSIRSCPAWVGLTPLRSASWLSIPKTRDISSCVRLQYGDANHCSRHAHCFDLKPRFAAQPVKEENGNP